MKNISLIILGIIFSFLSALVTYKPAILQTKESGFLLSLSFIIPALAFGLLLSFTVNSFYRKISQEEVKGLILESILAWFSALAIVQVTGTFGTFISGAVGGYIISDGVKKICPQISLGTFGLAGLVGGVSFQFLMHERTLLFWFLAFLSWQMVMILSARLVLNTQNISTNSPSVSSKSNSIFQLAILIAVVVFISYYLNKLGMCLTGACSL
jgi:hypothetical protein